jgi:predicted metal-binding membrane protein
MTVTKTYSLPAFVFAAGLAATVYFCRSMSGGMDMPGGWTMSMAWMRMPGQSWPAASAMFMGMWLTMMVAMMLPSAMPMFLQYRREFWVGAGYFLVWLAVGVPVYTLGVAVAAGAMRWALLSRMVPALAGLTVVLAGLLQFAPWKTTALRCCRYPLHCLTVPDDGRTQAMQAGLRCGAKCALCCSSWMLILFVMGIMNLAVMGVVAIFIALEKRMPRPERLVRLSGGGAVLVGTTMLLNALLHF